MNKTTIEIEVPEGKRAVWKDGVLTLVEDDTLETEKGASPEPTLHDLFRAAGELAETFWQSCGAYPRPGKTAPETEAESETEKPYACTRATTLEEARDWCVENGYSRLVYALDLCGDALRGMPGEAVDDILAYLKLRVITCALNGGLSNDRDLRCAYAWSRDDGAIQTDTVPGDNRFYADSRMLWFKDEDTARHAATHFWDIYDDFS